MNLIQVYYEAALNVPTGSAISPPCRTSCPVAVWRCRIIYLPIYIREGSQTLESWTALASSKKNYHVFKTMSRHLWSFQDLTPTLPSTVIMIYLLFTYLDSHTLLCFLHLYSTKQHPLSPHNDQRFCTHSSPQFPLSHCVSCPIGHFVYQSSLHLFQLCYLTVLQTEINTISVQYSHFFFYASDKAQSAITEP